MNTRHTWGLIVHQSKLNIENISCHESQLRDVILPILRGSVFHVTNRLGLNGIVKDGLIRNNKNGKLPYSYETSARSHARTRGRVSLFDLRSISDDQLKLALNDYYFLSPPSTKNNPIFLIFSTSLYPALIPWTQARDENAGREAYIPHAETFHQGDISASSISHVVSVKIKRTRRRPNSLSKALEQAFTQLYRQPDEAS